MTALPPNIKSQLEAVTRKHAARLGLLLQDRPFVGEVMVLEVGGGPCEVRLDLTAPYWLDVLADEHAVLPGAVAMLEGFARRHGPGRVWSLNGLPIVHLVEDDGAVAILQARDPHDDQFKPAVRLRMLAAHERRASVMTSVARAARP